MRPAECALYFYHIPVENMKQMKTTTATKVGMSARRLIISHISFTHQQHTDPFHLWWQSHCGYQKTNRHSFSSAAPLCVCGGGVFVAGKGSDTELYCLTPWWILTTCATPLIYMDSSSTAAWMLARSLSPAWQIPRKYVPRPASCESALITASEGLTVLAKERCPFRYK